MCVFLFDLSGPVWDVHAQKSCYKLMSKEEHLSNLYLRKIQVGEI